MAEAESEDEVPSHELSSLNSAAARSTTGQADFAKKRAEARADVNAVKSVATRSTTGQADFVKKRAEARTDVNAVKSAATRSTTGQDDFNGKSAANSTVNPQDVALNGEGKPIMMCSQKGTMVPVSPGDQAEAIRKASEVDAKKLAAGDVEDTYGARVGVSLSLFGFKAGLGIGVHVIDKDNAVLVGDYEYGMSNVIGADLDYSGSSTFRVELT